MKKTLLPIILFTSAFILSSSGGKPKPPIWEQENVSFPMINSEIRNSLSEHEAQKDLRTEQNINLGLENTNKTQWQKYKNNVVKVQDRLRIVALSLQMIPSGYQIYLDSQKIKENQELLFKEIKETPYAILVVMPSQVQFVDDLQMTVRLLSGLVISYGAINQMERAERQKLLNYAVEEVRIILRQSRDILWQVRQFKEAMRLKKATLKYYVNRDAGIIQDILKNVKTI